MFVRSSVVIRQLVQRPDDVSMRRVVDTARADAFDDEDIADLAQALAASGHRMRPDPGSADVASTGGPSSLSTLLCPLHLRARGFMVPKLGVPGRPAGGVDVLQTIPGYEAALAPQVAERALTRHGYVHLLADQRWAPLDARLFAFRQREGAQTLAPLVIASILAKKLAAGTVGAGLEIRIAGHGNFGADLETARRHAHRYNAVARALDLRPVCALTDGARPYQPYIGRGEALVALSDVLNGRATGWLAAHHALCERISDAIARSMGADVAHPSGLSKLREAHHALLEAHGVEPHAFDTQVEGIRTAPRSTVRATHVGTVAYDLGRLRELLVAIQQTVLRTGVPVPDPAGVILRRPAGTQVDAGEPLMSIRVPPGESRLAAELGSCALVLPASDPPSSALDTLEII